MLFRKKIQPMCAYCRHATILDEEEVKCARKGTRQFDDKCFFFSYDPTKRQPKKAKAVDFSKYEEYDYSL